MSIKRREAEGCSVESHVSNRIGENPPYGMIEGDRGNMSPRCVRLGPTRLESSALLLSRISRIPRFNSIQIFFAGRRRISRKPAMPTPPSASTDGSGHERHANAWNPSMKKEAGGEPAGGTVYRKVCDLDVNPPP